VHIRDRRRGRSLAIATVAAFATLTVGAAGAQADTAPVLNAPGPGKLIHLGSHPIFKVTDTGHAFGTEWLSVSKYRRRDRFGRLKQQSPGGDFSDMVRHRHGHFTFTPPTFSFPGWFMVTPGTYYWQTYHINCAIPNAQKTNCHVYSRVRSFRVA
jgi:hypothetical protein